MKSDFVEMNTIRRGECLPTITAFEYFILIQFVNWPGNSVELIN